MTDYKGLREYLRTAEQLVKADFPGDAFRRATTALEEHASSLLGSGPKSDSLYTKIEELRARKIIGPPLARRLHAIRKRRNELTHELRDATPEEAQAAIRVVEQFCCQGPRLAWQFRSPFEIGSVGRNRPVRDALVMMREHDFSQLLVVKRNSKPLRRAAIAGLVTEWSILKAWSNGGEVSDLRVADCLAKEKPAFCTAEDDAPSLWKKLERTPLVCLVEDKEVTGVIVRADLIAIVAASGACDL